MHTLRARQISAPHTLEVFDFSYGNPYILLSILPPPHPISSFVQFERTGQILASARMRSFIFVWKCGNPMHFAFHNGHRLLVQFQRRRQISAPRTLEILCFLIEILLLSILPTPLVQSQRARQISAPHTLEILHFRFESLRFALHTAPSPPGAI